MSLKPDPIRPVPEATARVAKAAFRTGNPLLRLRDELGAVFADAAYDSAANRGLCLSDGIQPCIRKVGEPHGSGLGSVRCVVEHDCAWLLANKRLDRRQDRLGRIILALPTAACIFIVANRISAF